MSSLPLQFLLLTVAGWMTEITSVSRDEPVRRRLAHYEVPVHDRVGAGLAAAIGAAVHFTPDHALP